MKLLVISEGYYPQIGGLEKIVQELCEGLYNAYDYKVDVLTCSPDDEGHTEIVNGIRVNYVPLNAKLGILNLCKELPRAMSVLKKLLKNEEYDIVSIQYLGYWSVLFLISGYAKRIPYSISIHGADINAVKSSGVRFYFQRKILEQSKVVISNSVYLAEQAEKRLGISLEGKKQVVWNGIHTENYCPAPHLQSAKKIVTIGRFVYKKGFDVFLDAIKQVKKTIPDLSVLMAGDGIELQHCKKLVVEYDLSDTVDFVGKIQNTDVPDFLRQARLFVLPSRDEPFGIVVLEALACGIPTIITDSGGATEIIENNVDGYVVPVENPKAMAEKIIELVSDDAKLDDFRQRGLEKVRLFSIDRMVEKYNEILQNLLTNNDNT